MVKFRDQFPLPGPLFFRPQLIILAEEKKQRKEEKNGGKEEEEQNNNLSSGPSPSYHPRIDVWLGREEWGKEEGEETCSSYLPFLLPPVAVTHLD